MDNKRLFFIALIPNRDLRKKIMDVQHDFERFNSRKALKVYPHITLKAPFECTEGGRVELLSWFSELVIRQRPFLITLKGFASFENKKSPVIYIKPIVTKELINMQQELMTGFTSIFPGYIQPVDVKFTPHVTVAYRDLSAEMLKKAWAEYKDKSFNDVFEVTAIYLLEHDRKKWNVVKTHELGVPAS